MSNIRSHSTFVHSVSRLFQPLNLLPPQAEVKYNDITSKSQKVSFIYNSTIYNIMIIQLMNNLSSITLKFKILTNFCVIEN